MKTTLPECAVLTCSNTADPRWFAYDVNGLLVMICDGHVLLPKPSEVTARLPDPTVLDLATRIVRNSGNSYSPTPGEIDRVAYALLADQEELAELRDLADLVNDADISTLPPELLAVRQRWLAKRHDQEVAEDQARHAELWELLQREDVVIVRCRRCGFEAFPFADATFEGHMKDHTQVKIVSKVSDPPTISAVDVSRIRQESQQLHDAFSARTASIEILTVDDLKSRAK